MDNLDINAIALNNRKIVAKKTAAKAKNFAPKHKKGELFLCGPIPWNWLTTASNANGKGSAVQVALGIWFLSGLNHKAATIKLTRKTLKQLGIERNAGYRGLKVLEESGLVNVIRKPGACPIVTILDSAAVEKTMDLVDTAIGLCAPVHDAILSKVTPLDEPNSNTKQNQVIRAESNEIVLGRLRLKSKLNATSYPAQDEKRGVNMSDDVVAIIPISEQSLPDHTPLSIAEAEACSP